jgi:hypothetical protein
VPQHKRPAARYQPAPYHHIGAISGHALGGTLRNNLYTMSDVAYNDYLVTYPDAKYPAKSMLL